MSPHRPGQPDPQVSVDRQRQYLRNVLAAGSGICAVCRSRASGDYRVCFQCDGHRRAGGQLADAVMPISYSIRGGEHAHALRTCKADPPSLSKRYDLAALGILYLRRHYSCLVAAMGGAPTHVAVVPSTRKPGRHPLDEILGCRLGRPSIPVTVNPTYGPEERSFHADWFRPSEIPRGARVLLLDDTWTTGSRIQSLAHAVKQAGARTAVAVVLGRHINGTDPQSRAVVAQIDGQGPFRLDRCALADHS